MSLVSVIIPTYNRAHLIERAVNSVLEQTYDKLEIIVVDDGSTDNTGNVLSQLQDGDSRVRYIRHETNKGSQSARNTGIRNARGDYVAFLDSDDEWLPYKLEKQIPLFQNTERNIGVV
ncbi:MAG: glycosyltransferase family 2 protein, partial [Desulfomonilaceae bacterium]